MAEKKTVWCGMGTPKMHSLHKVGVIWDGVGIGN